MSGNSEEPGLRCRLRARRGVIRRAGRIATSLAVLAASVAVGAAALTAATLGSAVPAGADTPSFSTTCDIPGFGVEVLPTTITGSIPASIADGTVFNVSGYQWLITIPAALTTAINNFYAVGVTVTSNISVTLDATGTTQGSDSETIDFPGVHTPASGSFLMTGTATSAPSFTGDGGAVSVTPGSGISAFNILVGSVPISSFSCTLPSSPPAIAFAQGSIGPFAYVVDGAEVTPVDLATDTPESPISFGEGSQPAAVAITPNGKTALVADQYLGAVDPITTATNAPGTPIPVGGAGSEPDAIAVSPDGSTAYIANDNGTLDLVSLATDTAGPVISIPGSSLSAVAITPDGSTAYVADQNNGVVYPVDLADDAVGSAISVGSAFAAPDAIAITPNGSTAFVVNNQDGTVVPIDISSNTAGSPISAVGYGAQYIAITPDGSTAYVTNNQTVVASNCCASEVTPIDTGSDTAGPPIVAVPLGGQTGSGSIALSPDGSTAYVGGAGTTVVPITTATATAESPLSFCSTSCGQMAITPDQGPTASLSVTTTSGVTTLDASASVASTSPITSYSWNFGDGSGTTVTSVPTITHVYAPGSYTATVTETDAAGASTAQVFTGQTVSLNGSAAAAASAPVVVASTGCTASSTCAASVSAPATASSPAQNVTVTTPTPSGTSEVLSVTSGPGLLKCSSGFHQLGEVTSYQATFTPAGNVHVKDVVLGATTTVGLQVCFQGTGHPSADLQMCTASAAPCISSLRVVGAGVKVALVIPPGDPRWKIDGVVSATESPAGIPSTAAVGTKIKITGTDLLGPNGQTVPSVGFTSVVGSTVTGVVVSATSTAIKVKVPNGAASGPVTLVWPQVAEAPAVTATSSTVKIT